MRTSYLIAAALTITVSALAGAQTSNPTAVRESQPIGPGRIQLLVDSATFPGFGAELAEITIAPGAPATAHQHGNNEIIYVIEGELDHTVNGTTTRLSPGMVGLVRKGETVTHRAASSTPVRALVIWTPGGEAERLIASMGVGPKKPVGSGPPAPALTNDDRAKTIAFLHSMVTAQEVFFTDSDRYTNRFAALKVPQLPAGWAIDSLITGNAGNAWKVIVSSSSAGLRCAVAVAMENPLIPTAGEGEPVCKPRPMP
jgi:quercetin dioxygenase-like cupin family protein